MCIRPNPLAVAVVMGLVVGVLSCDKNPPTSPTPLPPPGGVPPPVVVRSLELVAPLEIAPEESVQLTATAVMSDGSVANVSSQAQWSSPDASVVQLNSTGVAIGRKLGTTFVNASFNARSARAQIHVVPKDTFVLSGTVKDSGFGIENVMVAVVSGTGEGLTAASRPDGSFALYGIRGPVRIQLKKDGYLNLTEQIDVSAHRTQEFSMVPARGRTNYSGSYVLTISAGACHPASHSPLPDAANRRTYSASVTQDEGRLTVTLSDAELIVTNGYGNRFVGFVDPTDTVTFPIGDVYHYYYYSGHFDIVERFSPTALVVHGIATARGTPQLISGTLTGWIAISSRGIPPFSPYLVGCYSTTHSFDMVRR